MFVVDRDAAHRSRDLSVAGPQPDVEDRLVDWAAGDGLVITVDGEPVQRLRDCELRSSTHHTNKGEQHVEVSHHR